MNLLDVKFPQADENSFNRPATLLTFIVEVGGWIGCSGCSGCFDCSDCSEASALLGDSLCSSSEEGLSHLNYWCVRFYSSNSIFLSPH